MLLQQRPRSFPNVALQQVAQLSAGVFAFASLALATAVPAQAIVIPAGHRLVFVVNEDRAGGEAYREKYFSRNFPLAKSQGMYECHSFRVDEVISGGRRPQAASFFAWSSPEAADRFREETEYATRYAPTRHEGWNDLQSFYTNLTEPVVLELNREKHYTAAAVWLKDPEAYATVFNAMETLRAELGCRVVLQQPVHRYESVRDGVGPAPDWILLMEWQNAAGPAQYVQSATFQRLQGRHDAAVARLEMYGLGFW